ncbi:MAG: leucine--tRNA ligase [Candidatus Kerfeldbacteria bacterium]|nr:leucine--tRNA ligase [Candidatus Kerfeldbacteria bacterium]
MRKHYNHSEVEQRWQESWKRDQVWRVSDTASGDSSYVLDMFPYPSAQGLHVGHPEGYTASDIYTRYLRARGKSVLHPMGFDSFGLPAENYAIKTGTHPAKTTAENIANMRRQIQSLGFSYDWSREVITSDPKYYRWTQWIFVQLFKHGLAYEADAPINWCPKDKTGLANEEVVDGKCERCGTPVTKKQIKQWLVKITDERYIERLLHGLDTVDWPESIKLLQRNWIGRSEGATIHFPIEAQWPKRVIILHGYQGSPDTGFKVWLRAELEKHGTRVDAPQLSIEEMPSLEENLKIVKSLKPDSDTVILGHSLGCVLALEAVQQLGLKLAGLVLLAPPHVPAQPNVTYPAGVSQYSDYDYDVKKINRQVPRITVIGDTHDDLVAPAEPKALAELLGAHLIMEQAPRPHYANRELGSFAVPTVLAAIASGANQQVTVFTTRPDTIFGATYVVLSPEHSLVGLITTDKQRSAVEQYQKEAAAKSDLERTDLAKNKTGVFTGAYAVNPVNDKKMPIWIADYVLSTYGTGAIMAVPAHDERDHAFAQKFKLPIVPVIQPDRVMPKMQPPMGSAGAWGTLDSDIEYTCWTGDGEMINSGEYNGMDSVEFKKKIIAWLEKKDLGKTSINYKMRDWLFSRQRYWGEPIPIVHCAKCEAAAVPEKDLPVTLPDVEKYEPTGTGESPLAAIESWVNTTCPECGGPAKRETNTMPQWAGSNWYFLRYCDPHNDKQLADPEKLKAWLPVDMYVGGAEHAVLHLLYARFIYKFLFDIGAVPNECGEEPFVKLKNQGIILGEDGQKMSKSRGNVINPDDVVKEYGADVLRMYEMFMGPFEDAKPWSTKGIIGVRRFVERVWEIFDRVERGKTEVGSTLLHQTIQSVSEKIELFRFNTCISDLMKLTNEWGTASVAQTSFERFLQLLAPFAPHLAQELWHQLGHTTYIENEGWPKFDPAKIVKTEATYAIQVNGKLRDTLVMPTDAPQEVVVEKAKTSVAVQRHLTGEPKKVIFVPKKLVNFVV